MPKNKSRRLHSKGGDPNIITTPNSSSSSSSNSTLTPTSTSSKPKSNSNGLLDFFSNAWNDTTKNTKNMYDNLMGKKSNTTNTSSLSNTNSLSNTSSSTPILYNSQSQQPTPISSSTSLTDYNIKNTGGRKTTKKGGRPASVYGLEVAKPTYWIKGGKKTKGKRRRSSHKKSNKRR